MITLHQPPSSMSTWGIPNPSPFCTKLETWLRMAKVPYDVRPGNPVEAPKGKIPYIRHEGRLMGDSGMIIEYLTEKFDVTLDRRLTAAENARGHAIRRMIEEHTYFAMARLRWGDDASWPYVYDYFKKLFPPVVGAVAVPIIRRNFLRRIHAQGVGRHTREEVIDLARSDFNALSGLLGDQGFILGDAPSTYDATVFAFTIGVAWVPWESPVKAHVRGLANVMAYCDRMKSLYWSS